jgi:hypothetical protein
MLPTTTSTLQRRLLGSMQLWPERSLTLLTLLLVPPAVHAQKTWVKVCEKANAVTKDKDGKDLK